MDRIRQMCSEMGVLLAKPRDRVEDTPRHGFARAIRGSRAAPRPPPETKGRRQLLRDELDLLLRPLRSSRIVHRLRLLELGAQALEPLAVLASRLRVEHFTRVAEIG